MAVTGSDVESIPFVPSFHHSARVQDLIGFQWPAFAIAGAIAPVPQLFYADRKPAVPAKAGYAVLALTAGLYWFLVGVWLDTRVVRRKKPNHSRAVRNSFLVAFVLTTLFLVVFLGKDLLGGWPEGPQGAYGLTAWLALTSAILLTEINGFQHRRATIPKL